MFRSRTAMDEDGTSCSQLHSNFFFRDTAAAEDVRGVPVCVDKDGAYFWYMADDRSDFAAYCNLSPLTLVPARLRYTKKSLPEQIRRGLPLLLDHAICRRYDLVTFVSR